MSAWIWLVIALVFALIEITNFAFYAAFLAVGALSAAIAAWLGGGIVAELIVFGGVTFAGLLLARRPVLHLLEGRNDRELVSGPRGMIGQEGVVVERVLGHHPPGVVRARGEEWPAVSYDPDAHEPGEIVLIVDLDRTRVRGYEHLTGTADEDRTNKGETVLIAAGGSSAGLIIAIIAAVIIFILVVQITRKSVRVVQQGNVGVVKRLGKYKPPVRQPGLRVVLPLVETIERVDIREEPRVGDLQQVITKDNVSVQVNATIYSQVVDVELALFEVSNYHVAVEQLARTALRAVFGGMTLDEALSERQRINSELQTHMSSATEKWGVRLNRIEIVDILPPGNILNAMSLQKEADQQKRAAILQSEGQQQAAINTAQGEKQAAVLRAEGDRQSAILRAEAAKQATILEAEAARQSAILRAEGNKQATVQTAEGRSSAIELVYKAIHDGNVTPELLAVLQLDTLGQVANSDNAKLVVPVETAGLLGAAQALRSVLAAVPEAGAAGGAAATVAAAAAAGAAAKGAGRALPPGR